ncbi:MAG: glucokinase [Halieaceae bacterium]|jgi:glucokinase
MSARAWYLLADIGGTNARFALGDVQSGTLSQQLTVSVAECETFAAALDLYLASVKAQTCWERSPRNACLAVAGPADTGFVTFTNSAWVVDRRDLAQSLGVKELHLINDFEAIGHAIPTLRSDDWAQVGGGVDVLGKPQVVLGPGTGLGVCSVVPEGTDFRVLAGEGGHVDFAPTDQEETEILRLLLTRYQRVSAERLLSGAGLLNIYWALTELRGHGRSHGTPADISAAALANTDPVATEALAVFCRVLGSVAGNLALTLGAHGGVYIAGGIVPRMLDFLARSDFRERFVAKGRFRSYLDSIPTRAITRDNPGLLGALRFLQAQE